MQARSVRQANPQFVGKIVRSASFLDNKFLITFTDDSYIEVETDDEPLGYDVEE